ncbi:menaquinone biosynthesis protein [Alteribacter aurantiacus]|uniref:menaquinone biosynthesis protein n=1 Tax=Alteribacter aurantiacus TaxID=254410 RepID=UPI00041A8A0C|nr:menaquinone biosynthesis protein [Alteribacter aurantiacus]
MSLVIGEISYTNILPIFYYVNREELIQRGCSFVPKVPSELNRAMKAGTVDIGGISSFAYAENKDDYKLLPNLSVSSPKSVGSIFLFSKVPIHKLDNKVVALTSSSATSVNLLKIILGSFLELNVDYVTMDPDYNKMIQQHDACLLIGDDAIRTCWAQKEDIYRYDLGKLWNDQTGYPMTYAVVAARSESLLKNERLVSDLYEQMVKSKGRSKRDHYKGMITSIQRQLGGSATFWHHYFAGLNHDLSARHIEGLLRYYDYAYNMGLIDSPVNNLSLWQGATDWKSV